jgi:hypothetical protein
MYNDTAGKMILNAAGEVVVETHNIADMPIVRFVNNLTPTLTAAKARWRNIVLHAATGTIYAQSATCEVWASKDNGATFALMASSRHTRTATASAPWESGKATGTSLWEMKPKADTSGTDPHGDLSATHPMQTVSGSRL